MLFPYQYLHHDMDTMQEYIQFILEEVWCKAVPGMDYDIDVLFAASPDLCGMITELHTQDLNGADTFLTCLQSLFEIFKTLDVAQKQQFKDWFTLNNDIQKLCEQGDHCQPATYAVISLNFPPEQFLSLVVELKRFYQNLYSADFLKLASVKSRIGEISDHNLQFTRLNDRDVCPFCGLSGMLGQYNSKREAYDHYFPKDKYPFSSINFHNLVPACSHCNSSYKLAKDPHYDTKDPLKTSRKVFYPFVDQPPQIEITININHPNWENLDIADVDVALGPGTLNSELGTWNDLYGIDERYKAECCSSGAGKAWLTEVFDEWQHLGGCPQEYMRRLELHCARDKFLELRFLKIAFLQGCQRAGLF